MTNKDFSPQARHAARQYAVQALYQWQLTAHNVEEIEFQFLIEKFQFLTEQEMESEKADIPYFRRLLHGILGKIGTLDESIVPFLDRDFEQIDLIERAILRIGCYELLFCPDVPWRVVINESVELAKIFGATESHKYVNGILDKLAHHLQKISETALE